MILSRRSMIKASLATGAAAFTAPVAALAADLRPTPEQQDAMARAAAAFMTTYGVPGLSIAYMVAGRPAYAEAFGVADPETGERLTTGHRFRIASITKPFTSVAVLQLVESGSLRLDTPVFGPDGVLADMFRVRPDRGALTRITVEHLLTHTSGGWPNDGHDPMFSAPAIGQHELIQRTLDAVPQTADPGTHYAYSNFGFCILGRVIERITRQSYAAAVQERVLRRCGINDMQIGGNTLAERADGEVRYLGFDGANRQPYDINVRRMDSHGGWIAQAGDLARFIAAIDGSSGGGPLLSPAMFQTMRTPSTASSTYAKGLMVNPQGNIFHNGSLPGTRTVMVRTRDNICWAGLTNTKARQPGMGRDLDRLMWTMARLVPAWQAASSDGPPRSDDAG